jgi:hypothetical protein
MTAEKTQAGYDTEWITAVQSFIVQVPVGLKYSGQFLHFSAVTFEGQRVVNSMEK